MNVTWHRNLASSLLDIPGGTVPRTSLTNSERLFAHRTIHYWKEWLGSYYSSDDFLRRSSGVRRTEKVMEAWCATEPVAARESDQFWLNGSNTNSRDIQGAWGSEQELLTVTIWIWKVCQISSFDGLAPRHRGGALGRWLAHKGSHFSNKLIHKWIYYLIGYWEIETSGGWDLWEDICHQYACLTGYNLPWPPPLPHFYLQAVMRWEHVCATSIQLQEGNFRSSTRPWALGWQGLCDASFSCHSRNTSSDQGRLDSKQHQAKNSTSEWGN